MITKQLWRLCSWLVLNKFSFMSYIVPTKNGHLIIKASSAYEAAKKSLKTWYKNNRKNISCIVSIFELLQYGKIAQEMQIL